MKTKLKRSLALLLCAVLLCGGVSLAETAPAEGEEAQDGVGLPVLPNVRMAMLYEESTDTILYEMNADEQNPPASMTKVMTAILVLEHDPELSGSMVIPEEALDPRYCNWLNNVHLYVGEEIRIEDLMKYLLILSANEAGTALAMYVTGDIPTFIDMMNEKAAELGMTETVFMDPHGLSSESMVSARDMITLSRYAMQNERFREIVRMRSGAVPASNMRRSPLIYQTSNRLMDPRSVNAYKCEFTEDVIGIKTGYIGAAGYNLAACMVKDDLTFYSVVMHGSDVIIDGVELLGSFVNSIDLLRFGRAFSKQGIEAGSVVTTARMQGSFKAELPLVAAEDLFILAPEGVAPTPEIVLDKIGSEVREGEQLGRVLLRDQFGNVRETALLAAEDRSVNPLIMPLAIGAPILVIALAVAALVLRARKRRAAAEAGAEESAQTT